MMREDSISSVAVLTCSRLVAWMRIGLLLRRLIWRRKVGVALYHTIDPQTLASHLRVLRKNYSLIPLGTLVDALSTNDWRRVPRHALAITFDDGMKDLYGLKELLAENDVPITAYLVSDVVGTHRHFWFNEIKDLEVVEQLKRESNTRRLAYLDSHVGYADDKEYDDRQALSMGEVSDLMACGVQFGCHTASHPILPACEDSVAEQEIVTAKAELEMRIGSPVDHFSYPNGDYTARDENLVRRAGYRSARTTERGLNDARTSPYRLRIVDVLEDRSAADLELIECRLVWYRIQSWWRGVRR